MSTESLTSTGTMSSIESCFAVESSLNKPAPPIDVGLVRRGGEAQQDMR